jgi:hypothetical protein
MARAEINLRDYLTMKWQARAKQAARTAGDMVAQGQPLMMTFGVVDGIMAKFAADVRLRFQADLGRFYKLGRVAAWKKASGRTSASLAYQVPGSSELDRPRVKKAIKPRTDVSITPSFNVVDEKAVSDLQNDQMIWIGTHYDDHVREVLREVVGPEVVAGHGAVSAGKAVRAAYDKALTYVKLPNGAIGREKSYFEGLAANTATNARVRGSIQSFSELGIVTYEIVNPMDDRTTEFCAWMNGKQFSVADAEAHIRLLSGATSPEFVKKYHPWLSLSQLKQISSGPGNVSDEESSALAAAGLPLPPYHFRCRTTVDAVA